LLRSDGKELRDELFCGHAVEERISWTKPHVSEQRIASIFKVKMYDKAKD
jgi:hypothetical protein